MTLWNNGTAQYVGIPVNTGAPGADTTDGSFAVFEHVRYSDMKGTNPDGTTYNDPNVPYASYFNGGDASARLHPLLLRHAAEQRLRRNDLCRRLPGVAADADRDTGDRRGAELRDGAAVHDDHVHVVDHDHDGAGTGRRHDDHGSLRSPGDDAGCSDRRDGDGRDALTGG